MSGKNTEHVNGIDYGACLFCGRTRHCGTCEYSYIRETIRVCEHMDIGLYCSNLGNICGRWEAKTNE